VSISELIIIAKPTTGGLVIVSFDAVKDKTETLGSIAHPRIAGTLLEQIRPLKEIIERKGK
jgi:hypothetical protein